MPRKRVTLFLDPYASFLLVGEIAFKFGDAMLRNALVGAQFLARLVRDALRSRVLAGHHQLQFAPRSRDSGVDGRCDAFGQRLQERNIFGFRKLCMDGINQGLEGLFADRAVYAVLCAQLLLDVRSVQLGRRCSAGEAVGDDLVHEVGIVTVRAAAGFRLVLHGLCHGRFAFRFVKPGLTNLGSMLLLS
ncbi:hypothetical protein OG2516_01506 [Oceanicola granulosus HTCC2516]|uniref:Uncharacterized protein n=1 Tax=Oceanicola granulosus (strain ATCC BAA-861 / DSM 15982 / KCTC 12143 / HTCC2516) TaxID=314256 RepID=Q2CFY8_OCEGH|nr:hypothetical protein OG2516_01506 [Oceanicola granulosus HTCC2516]